MTDTAQLDPETALGDNSVHLEAHGLPGTHGRPAGEIRIAATEGIGRSLFWLKDPSREIDLHVGFKAEVNLERRTRLTLRTQASSAYRLWIDGETIVHGPLRFAHSVPEYQEQELQLEAGVHEVCIEAHHEGITYRSTTLIPPFVLVQFSEAGTVLPVGWKGRELDYYRPTGLRVSPLMGWLEVHTHPGADQWREAPLSESGWEDVTTAGGELAEAKWIPSAVTLPQWPERPMRPYASGVYTDTFSGYDLDDLSVQFLLADDAPHPSQPVDGTFHRYDLGKARIGTVDIDIESDSPATVVIAYCDRLTPAGRPSPVVALSAGPTRMIQIFAVGPGLTQIRPLQSLGGRYIEVRIETAGSSSITGARFRERDLLGEALASFHTDDTELNRIWDVGIETLRSTTEDAVVDSIRERGEWIGDVGSAALPVMAAGWGHADPVRRALIHAAALAREDGMVAGCGPGEIIYLSTFAAQWVQACLDAAATEGSDELLLELFEPAAANIKALTDSVEGGSTSALPWGFVDWGYVPRFAHADPAVLAHLVIAVDSWIEWLKRLSRDADIEYWRARRRRVRDMLATALDQDSTSYHGLVLGYLAGVVDRDQAVRAINERFEGGFPFAPNGRRMRNPLSVDPSATTPYFTNFSMPILLDAGEGQRVRELWKRGWGWMLDQGATTWWEIFDPRWSQCHSWSSAPTWQLSRYTLGIRVGRDAQPSLAVNTLGLARARGTVFVGSSLVSIEWQIVDDTGDVKWTATSSSPLWLQTAQGRVLISSVATSLRLQQVQGDLYR